MVPYKVLYCELETLPKLMGKVQCQVRSIEQFPEPWDPFQILLIIAQCERSYFYVTLSHFHVLKLHPIL